MLYHPAVPVNQLVPVFTLKQSINYVNICMSQLGRNLVLWNFEQQDRIGQLLRANWIYQNLKTEPIRKPILVHQENKKFLVDCGDTRLMALSMLDDPGTVSVIATCRHDAMSEYNSWNPPWQPIHNDQALIKILGFDPVHTSILFTLSDNSKSYALDWLEIGDQSTAHHLHDPNERTNIMHKYLSEQSVDFKFDEPWARSAIDWAKYQSN